jgi:hypothetical protein
MLGWEKVYWIGHKRPLEHWTKATDGEFDHYTVVGGHASAVEFEKIKRPKIFMSVVRDPVMRAISLFNYITWGPDPNHGLRKKLQGLTLIEAIQTSAGFRRDIENCQCRYLSGEPSFPAALRRICESEWFVDRHEAIDELFSRVCRRFGWPAQKLVLDNVGRKGYADEYLEDVETICALQQINQEDRFLVSLFDRNDFGDTTAVESVSSAPRGAAQMVTAIYNAVLGRPADPAGLETYVTVFTGVSVPQGVERVIRGLLASPEFQNKRTAGAQQLLADRGCV